MRYALCGSAGLSGVSRKQHCIVERKVWIRKDDDFYESYETEKTSEEKRETRAGTSRTAFQLPVDAQGVQRAHTHIETAGGWEGGNTVGVEVRIRM